MKQPTVNWQKVSMVQLTDLEKTTHYINNDKTEMGFNKLKINREQNLL